MRGDFSPFRAILGGFPLENTVYIRNPIAGEGEAAEAEAD